MMTLATEKVISIVNDLNEFIKKDIELPVQFAWDLDDNYEELKKITDKFEKHKNEILQKLASENKIYQDGDVIRPTEGCDKEFQEVASKISQYLEIENEVNIKKVSSTELPEKISSKDLKALKFMIER